MLLVLLLGACAFADFRARMKMDMANRKFAIIDDRTVREMRLIDFIPTHFWIVVAYVALSLVCLLWLEFRAASRWSVWVTFTVLALPTLAYGSACLHNKWLRSPPDKRFGPVA